MADHISINRSLRESITEERGDLPVGRQVPQNLRAPNAEIAAHILLNTSTANAITTTVATGGSPDISCGGEASGGKEEVKELHDEEKKFLFS